MWSLESLKAHLWLTLYFYYRALLQTFLYHLYLYTHKYVSTVVYSFVVYINEIRGCLALCDLLFYSKIFLCEPIYMGSYFDR